MTSEMAPPPSPGPSKRKRKFFDMDKASSIVSSQGPKSCPSFTILLYRLGIFEEGVVGTIPPDSGKHQIHQFSPKPEDIISISDLLTSWFSICMPNEATLVFHICHHLFPWNIQTPAESHIFLLYEFPGSFTGHNTEELRKWGDGEIKYPLVKCDPSQGKSKIL